jgi:Leucine-rich repeat (LRR) protein
MPLLEEVDLSFGLIEDVSSLSHCQKLKKLTLTGNKAVEDLSPLCQYPNLEEFEISGLALIKDFSFFEKIITSATCKWMT